MARSTPEGVIVLGCPRSGTTLLRRLLDAHPSIACPPETAVFSRVGRMLREDPLSEGLAFGLRTGLAFSGIDPEDTLAQVRELAFGFHRRIAASQGKPRWASKTAMDALYVDEIEELCGDRVQYVGVVRHGLDVACSLRDLCRDNDAFLPEIHAYIRQWPFQLEALTRLWADVTARIRRLCDDHPRTARLVRYEDLVAQPSETMAELFAFLGEPAPADLVDQALRRAPVVGFGDARAQARDRIDADRVGRWRLELTPHTRGRLGAIANPTLAAHGYDAVPQAPPRTDADARRWYALGLAVRGLRGTGGTGTGGER